MRAMLTSRASPVKLSGKWSNTGSKPKRLRPKPIAIRPGSRSWRASLRVYDRSRPPHNEVGMYRPTTPQLLRDAQNPKALQPDGRRRSRR